MITIMRSFSYLEYLGLFFITLVSSKFALFILHLFKVYFFGSYPNFKKFGSWSVVTGATDGIGLAFAQELARKGQNIVLISRSAEKLETAASSIKKDYGVEVKTIQADFSDLSIYENINAEIKGLDIGVLVNNVGISFEFPEYFTDLADRKNIIDKMLLVNVASVFKMTDIVLPIMSSKKKGIILNLSSGAAMHPTPLLSLYSATKQCVDCFSKCLYHECKNKGIIVQSIMPYFVATKLSKIRRTSWLIPSPSKYVRSALSTIGETSRSYGYYAHAIQGAIISMIPESFYIPGAASMNNQTRKRALKKLASKKE